MVHKFTEFTVLITVMYMIWNQSLGQKFISLSTLFFSGWNKIRKFNNIFNARMEIIIRLEKCVAVFVTLFSLSHPFHRILFRNSIFLKLFLFFSAQFHNFFLCFLLF